MGERKGQQFYYPPDFDYKKHKSLNHYHGVHALRERAKDLKTEGVLVIRFEMPYNIYCSGCKNHIGMGVRYNAKKKCIGKYFSTKLWLFRMKCHLCDNYIEMKTDPENRAYTIVSGARKAVEDFDPEELEGAEVLDTSEEKQKLDNDAFFKLEHGFDDSKAAESTEPIVTQLQKLSDNRWKDDYSNARNLRKTFRTKKKKIKAQNELDSVHHPSLNVPLLMPSSTDNSEAEKIKFFGNSSRMKEVSRKRELATSSIFSNSKVKKKAKLIDTSKQKKLSKEDKLQILKHNLRKQMRAGKRTS